MQDRQHGKVPEKTSTPRLLWHENFEIQGGLNGLDEENWSTSVGNGSEYGIPGHLTNLWQPVSIAQIRPKHAALAS